MQDNYDVIIIGAGSVGIPTAMALSNNKIKILVIDAKSAPGQGDNKKAIGGVRATHSEYAKIMIGKRSLEIFSNWEDIHGENIEWMKGGYLFPIYRHEENNILTKLIPIQQKFGLEINLIDKVETQNIVPGINTNKLIGSAFSPNDGSASPLLSINAFTKKSLENGVKFKFKEIVKQLLINKNKIMGIETNKKKYFSSIIIDAAGKYSSKLCRASNLNIQVTPDSHEAAITEPINRLFKCMIVDLRPEIKSKNFYFYQNIHGQIIFCITPSPAVIGINTDETSSFLPQATRRILNLIPKLNNVRVRRMWRGCYPMTPDGAPIVGWNPKIEGFFHATGMCGQGFMFGPGIGELTSRMIAKKQTKQDIKIIEAFSPKRHFSKKQESLK